MESKIDGKTQYMSDRTADNEPFGRCSKNMPSIIIRNAIIKEKAMND